MGSSDTESIFLSNEEEEEEASMFAWQLAFSSIFPMALKAAIQLNVLEIIDKAGPNAYLSAIQITSHIPTQNPDAPAMLDRILRLLASHSVLKCTLINGDNGDVERIYGLEPVCKFLIRNRDGGSFGTFLLTSLSKIFIQPWQYLKDAVVEGGVPFNKAFGMNAFDYFGTDPNYRNDFNNSVADISILTMKKILEIYKGFEGINVLVDVGGGVGVELSMIVSKYPNIKGINFDLPHAIADAPAYPGVVHAGGDMFQNVPSGDAIFMKWVLHGWSDEFCLKLLKNCYKALPDLGKVIVAESMIPTTAEANPAANCAFGSDVLMLAFAAGGKERTENEFKTLALKAGFSDFKVICRAYNSWVMEFYKTM